MDTGYKQYRCVAVSVAVSQCRSVAQTQSRPSFHPSIHHAIKGSVWLPAVSTAYLPAPISARARRPIHRRFARRSLPSLPLQCTVRNYTSHHPQRSSFFRPHPNPDQIPKTTWPRPAELKPRAPPHSARLFPRRPLVLKSIPITIWTLIPTTTPPAHTHAPLLITDTPKVHIPSSEGPPVSPAANARWYAFQCP